MKGIILAGGKATRLRPLTKITSKQLLPVYDKPMIYYPLETLLKAGIKEILIIIAPDYSGHFLNLLGSGREFGAKFSYEIQEEPRGLADAFIVGENFIGKDSVTMILGDNIFDHDFTESIKTFKSGAKIFAKKVSDPERFGVVEFDKDNKVISVEEKPAKPKSNYAAVGMYIYDNRVVDLAKNMKPSARGELEITDLNNIYLKKNELSVDIIDGLWEDAGTFDSLLRASNVMAAKAKEEGGKIVKRLLVTGGAGFIGSNFIHYMLKKHQDIEIVNLDALTYAGNLENLRGIEDDPRYSFVKGDITIPEDVQRAIKGCDTVVHFAAETHVDRSILEPAAFIKTNLLGTQVLLDAALKEGVKRFHHVSTDEVFGALPLEGGKFTEETPYDPHSPYSASKAGADHLVRAYGDTFGLPFTITNCSNNYGPYHFPEKVIPLFIINAYEDKPLPIYGTGKCVRDYLYVEDHCEAIDLVLEKGKVGETYCVGGGAEKNGIEIADKILELMEKPERLKTFVKDRPGHDLRYAIDASKIEKELGWKPKHNFEQGMKDTIKWYMDNKEWWEKIRSGEYKDYYKKQYEV